MCAIVQAYMKVAESNESLQTEQDFFSDLYGCVVAKAHGIVYGICLLQAAIRMRFDEWCETEYCCRCYLIFLFHFVIQDGQTLLCCPGRRLVEL